MSELSTIPELLEDIKRGRMVILVDDEDRENEGDLVFPAEDCTPEMINFLLKEARGELCLSLSGEICDKLGLKLQADGAPNRTRGICAFTETIEAAQGVTTGTSAFDRAMTCRVAAQPNASAEDITKPGHIHPLRARPGGVLVRPGHTEGSVDLCRLAGKSEAAVIMEILNDDGTMARMPDLKKFAVKHNMKVGAIADLVEWRRKNEELVTRVSTIPLPTPFGDFMLSAYSSPYDDREHIALTRGLDFPEGNEALAALEEPVLGRVHSECLTGDLFHSRRCDCGEQLDAALAMVGQAERGFILYMRQEGRGIGLMNKLKAYALQDEGMDTVEANEALGFLPDARNYGTGASILHDLGIRRIKLLTNNPTKRKALNGYGLEIVDRVPMVTEPNAHNARYLEAKRTKMGHML